MEIIGQDAAEFVRKLKTEEGKDIFVISGGLLAKPLFEANLIDEVRDYSSGSDRFGRSALSRNESPD